MLVYRPLYLGMELNTHGRRADSANRALTTSTWPSVSCCPPACDNEDHIRATKLVLTPFKIIDKHAVFRGEGVVDERNVEGVSLDAYKWKVDDVASFN